MGGFLRQLTRYGESLVSVSDLSRVAYLPYLSAHALARFDGIPCESRRGNKGLCSGRDFKSVGVLVAVGVVVVVVRLNLRDVSVMRCRARRSLVFSTMTTTEGGGERSGEIDAK